MKTQTTSVSSLNVFNVNKLTQVDISITGGINLVCFTYNVLELNNGYLFVLIKYKGNDFMQMCTFVVGTV